MGVLFQFLLTVVVLDCGSGARLETGPQVRLLAAGKVHVLPGVSGGVDACAFYAPGNLLHVEMGSVQKLIFLHPQGMQTVRTGRTDAEHPWRFDASSGEVYQEAAGCGARRVNRERYDGRQWLPVNDASPPPAGERKAVRGLPPGILRRPWMNTPVPAVVHSRMDLSEDAPAPVALSDFDAETVWRAPKGASGVTFVYTLPSFFTPVHALSFVPGNAAEPALFAREARIRSLLVTAGGRSVRVRLDSDPAAVPGAHYTPWHVVFDTPVTEKCIEITVESLYGGETPVLSEITLYSAMDFAPDPVAHLAGHAGLWAPDVVARIAAGLSDEQLAQAWLRLEPLQKRKIASEIARRTAPGLLPAQVELLAWAPDNLLALLTRTLSRPAAQRLLEEKIRAGADPGFLERLLPPYLAAGGPDAQLLNDLVSRHPRLERVIRDALPAAGRAQMVASWCGSLHLRAALAGPWILQDAGLKDQAVQCLLSIQPSDARGKQLYLQLATLTGDRRLRARVQAIGRDAAFPALHLQALATLLRLDPTPQELRALVRGARRPDVQWMLVQHWPVSAPVLPEITEWVRSPWPPVARAALFLLADRCHASFSGAVRPLLQDPAREDWFALVHRVSSCGYGQLRPDLLKLFARPGLSIDAFTALAHVFAARGERRTAQAVSRRLQEFFSPKHNRRFFEEQASDGVRLLLALADYARPEDTTFFMELAGRDLPEPYLETLFSILVPRCRQPLAPPQRVWRRPAEFRAFLRACMNP